MKRLKLALKLQLKEYNVSSVNTKISKLISTDIGFISQFPNYWRNVIYFYLQSVNIIIILYIIRGGGGVEIMNTFQKFSEYYDYSQHYDVHTYKNPILCC